MANIAIYFCYRRVVETRNAVPGYAAESECVLVVLCTKPFVLIEFHRQVHFVTGSTEQIRLVQWLEEGLLELKPVPRSFLSERESAV